MFDGLLGINVVDGPVPIVVFVAAAVLLVAVLLRRPTRGWLLGLAIAIPAGLLAAVLTWLVCIRWLNLFGESLGYGNYMWIAGAYIGVAIAAVSIRRRPVWRIPVAVLAIPVFLLAAAIGINANYGLNRTVASVLAIAVPRPLKLAPPPNASSPRYDATLWKHWKPPADMPTHGTVGTATIPGTVSGFHARDAGLYLPPAALVAHPPVLPLIVMMMGQPGSPDPEPIADVLDQYAAKHRGLAPVVIVADQLSNPYYDTLCSDTSGYGKAETYVTKDVTAWAEKNLPVTHDHRFWTAAGYSNGGLCALSFAIDHPEVYSRILDISGEEFAGADRPERTLQQTFGGNEQAYDAVKPFIKLRHFRHPGMTAIFTACRDDPVYHHVAVQAQAVTRGAGMDSTLVDIATGGHGIGALMGGLTGGVKLLYPVLGLAQPG